ncbi:14615_t:CDS:2 [Dentiscutata erythropus]|uniref:14615_t:CDS:1 n=1 Tax=Dentiscutata erythropus TaxID=1348616 RepID=A0A9N9EX97_9GLOM|nr:14615_t:CDS:2 [Dentiscutata erythropus]
MEQKDRAYYLRVSQLVMVFLIIILEFVQAVGFAKNYRDTPTHSTVIYYWMATVFSFLLLGHLLIRFQPRWKHGPNKDEVLFDGNKQISSSIPMGSVNQQQQQTTPQRSPSYVMQEVVLKDGQPALVFHSNGDKRSSRRASLYNHQRTNSNGSSSPKDTHQRTNSNGSSSPKDTEFTKNARSVENHVTGENGNVKNVVN